MTGTGAAKDREEHPYLLLVSRRVRSRRVLVGITQDELAALAPMSRVTLGSIERGDHAASLLTYLKLARVLGVPMGSLLNEEPSGSPVADRIEGGPRSCQVVGCPARVKAGRRPSRRDAERS